MPEHRLEHPRPRGGHRFNAFRTTDALHGQAARYVISGVLSTATNLGSGLLLSGPLDVPIQVAIATAYIIALLVNYTLQRTFVFAHREEFALSERARFTRYVSLAAAQYVFVALVTAMLPDQLGISGQIVYVGAALAAATTTFVVLRLHVFHE